MKKITILTSCNNGGAERISVLYAKILHRNGFKCSFAIAQWRNDTPLIASIIPHYMPYHILNFYYGWLANIILAFRMLVEKTDIIFCSQPGNTKRLLRLKRLGLIRQKIVFRDFLMPHDQIKNPGDEGVDIFRNADAIIAQTEEMKNEMVKYYHLKPSAITVINNPLDKTLIADSIKEEYPFDHSYTNYIAINRIDPQKDMETILRAFALVQKKEPKSRLYICGNDGNKEYLAKLLKLADELHIKEYVFFEGPQSNPFKYLNYADVFCLSSLYEGLPNGMLEAMYLGIPVAVTRSIPYISQVVAEGKHGYTVETGNPEAFADAMLKASKLEIAEKFVDINNSEDKINNLFDSLI